MSTFVTCTPSLLSQQQFIDTFADIYEHSPWVAGDVYQQGIDDSINTISTLHLRMSDVLLQASHEQQLALINAHPDLAGRAAMNGELTEASTSEQAGAGIDQCSPEEFARFTELNDAYKAKFKFPFIKAVRGANRHLILADFERRIDNDMDTEFNQALLEINKIAGFRLNDL